MAKLIQLPNGRPINQSEAQVIQHLVDQLPNTYTIIPNAEIAQHGNPPFEYDAIVIAPHVVFVIEIKRWLGGIQGDDYTWVIAGLHNRPNPWLTTNNKARVLKSTIEQRDPGVGRFWVEALVALADLDGTLNLRGNCRQRAFRYTDLPAFLTDLSKLEGHTSDLRPLRARLENAVRTAARGRQAGPLQFGSYKVLETLSRRDHVSEFLARSQLLPDSPPVRLRVFNYNPYLTPADLEQHQARLRREAEALQKIGYHPNLINLKSFEADPQDPNLLVEVTDWSEGGTLRSLMSGAAALSLERKIELGLDLAAGLKAAHGANVIHRDLRPENVLIGADGGARLMNFDHARFAASGAKTVGPLVPEPGISQAYTAPELASLAVAAAPTSDLYSLGMILFELLVGDVLYRTPREALEAAQTCSGPIDFVSDIPAGLNMLVCDLLQIDPARRPPSAEDVLARLKELREKPSGTLIPPSPPTPPEPPVEPKLGEPVTFQFGDQIDGKYTVQKVLKPGGFGQVYKVYDDILEQVFALKIFNPGSLALNSLQQEARTLNNLDHKNIVKVRTWGRLAKSDRLYLVSDFVEGEELTHYTTPETRLSAREAVQVIVDLLSALAYLHPPVDRITELREKMAQGEITGEEYEEYQELQTRGFLHRDIKPGNLMLSPQGVRLIDFNIAARAAQAGRTYTGTPGYMLPDVGIMTWTTDGDLFATGIVLYELITGRHPYPPEGIPTIDSEPADPRSFVPDLSPRFSELLLQAVSCRPDVRYHSANRFRQDLLDLQGDYLQALLPAAVVSISIQPEEEGRKNYNPFVTRLLKLYSQAGRDNSGTRGLDKIGELTYVLTRLDLTLKPAILDGQYRLVVITGNAGDGKTAFIQRVEGTVAEAGSILEHPTLNSSRFQYRGLSFVTNYDGSQDEGADRANDQVLSEFFSAFDDAHFVGVAAATPVHLIAINEGRLVDFFSEAWSARGDPSSPAQRFHKLAGCIQRYFEREASLVHLPDWLLIVDLNQRSVVAADPDAEGTSIFDRQLLAFLKPEFWRSCQDCDLRSRCFIKYNFDTLSDSLAGPAVRERLRTLFEIVHLRHQLHITMRDLRSALSWMLFRDHGCEDVAHLLAVNESNWKILDKLYVNAFSLQGQLAAGQGEDRLVRLLRQIDPSGSANPELDRALHFRGLEGAPLLTFENRSGMLKELLEAWKKKLPTPWQAAQDPTGMELVQTRHGFLRRLAFFERRDPEWKKMLPYHNLDNFKDALKNDLAGNVTLKQTLANGFSYVEGAHHPEISQKFVCIRAGQTLKARVRSFRLFPLNDFDIQIPHFAENRFLEHSHDRFTFKHSPSDPTELITGSQPAALSISLDLLELLKEINNGYVPSMDDRNSIFINLTTFKNALAHLRYNRVLLTRDDKHFYELTQTDDASIRLQVWKSERTPDEA